MSLQLSAVGEFASRLLLMVGAIFLRKNKRVKPACQQELKNTSEDDEEENLEFPKKKIQIWWSPANIAQQFTREGSESVDSLPLEHWSKLLLCSAIDQNLSVEIYRCRCRDDNDDEPAL